MNKSKRKSAQVRHVMHRLGCRQKWDLIIERQNELECHIAEALASDANHHTRQILALNCMNTKILIKLLSDDHELVQSAAIESLRLLAQVDPEAAQAVRDNE